MKKIFSLSYKLGEKILLLKNSNTFKIFPVIIFISFIILLRCVTNQLANQIISMIILYCYSIIRNNLVVR